MSRATPSDPGRDRGVIAEFFAGFVVLGRGFGAWRRHPGLMLLGFVPALIVGGLFLALFVLVAVNIGAIGEFVTPFAHDWSEGIRNLVGYGAGAAVLVLLAVLAAFAFTAITLMAGEPVYSRIWSAVERDLGDHPPDKEPGFWRSARDAGRLVVQALAAAILLALVAVIPFVGPPLAAVGSMIITGRLVALELTARPLEARGMSRTARNTVLRTRNPRLIGFGVAVHLFYAVPLGAVVVMPAAVAGATFLARHAFDTYAVLGQLDPSEVADADADAAGADQPSKRPSSD